VKEFDKAELKERLTPTQYLVTQEHQTEKQFSNKYYKHREKGVYTCVVCSIQHFSSASKYDSGSGWPSFFDIIDKKKIRLRKDASGGLHQRMAVACDAQRMSLYTDIWFAYKLTLFQWVETFCG